MSGQDAIDVPVHNGFGQAEGDGADGGRGVVSDAFEGADAVIGLRESTECDDLPGGCMQVSGAAVITQALPASEHFVFRGFGEVLYSGPFLYELLPIGLALGDAGLLQDDFTEPDGVRVFRPPPGEIAPVCSIPVQDRLREVVIPHYYTHLGYLRRHSVRRGRRSRSYRPTRRRRTIRCSS